MGHVGPPVWRPLKARVRSTVSGHVTMQAVLVMFRSDGERAVFRLQVDGVRADEELHPVREQPGEAGAGGKHEMNPVAPAAQSEAGEGLPELPDSEDAAFNAMLEDAAPQAGHEELELEDLDKE